MRCEPRQYLELVTEKNGSYTKKQAIIFRLASPHLQYWPFKSKSYGIMFIERGQLWKFENQKKAWLGAIAMVLFCELCGIPPGERRFGHIWRVF
jgi:hypothetical protein